SLEKQKGGYTPPSFRSLRLRALKAVVYREFDGMGRHAEIGDLLHLELDVRVQHVIGEYAAASQELAILVEHFQRLVQGRTNVGNLLGLFRRQVVQVLVDGVARMNLVLHTVQPRQQHGGEGQVRIRGRIGEADLDTARLRAVYVRDAD